VENPANSGHGMRISFTGGGNTELKQQNQSQQCHQKKRSILSSTF
jgi:hypothetical protein